MDRFLKFSHKTIIIIALTFLTLILLSSFTSNYRMFYELIPENKHHLYLILVSLIAIPIAVGLYYLINKLIKVDNKVITLILFIIFIIIFILGALYYYHNFNYGQPYSDPFNIYDSAKSLYETNQLTAAQIKYIEIYPLNLPAIWYENAIFNLFKSTDIHLVSLVNATVFLVLMIAIISFSFFKIKKNGLTIFLIIALLGSIPNMAYASFYYTDIIGTNFFLLVGLLLMIMYYYQKDWVILYLVLGIIVGIGAAFRGNLLILGIALAIIAFLYLKSYKKLISIVLLVIVFVVKGQIITSLGQTYEVDTKTYAFPSTHWINMGQNSLSNGNYSRDDRIYIEDLIRSQGVEAASNYSKQSIVTRIQSRSLSQNITFYLDKLNNAWNEGSYGLYHNAIFSLNEQTQKPDNDPAYYNQETFVIYVLLDIIQKAFYMLGIIHLVWYYRKGNFSNFVITAVMLTFIGTVLFYLMWESRARYTYSIMPLLMVALGFMINQNNTREENIKET